MSPNAHLCFIHHYCSYYGTRVLFVYMYIILKVSREACWDPDNLNRLASSLFSVPYYKTWVGIPGKTELLVCKLKVEDLGVRSLKVNEKFLFLRKWIHFHCTHCKDTVPKLGKNIPRKETARLQSRIRIFICSAWDFITSFKPWLNCTAIADTFRFLRCLLVNSLLTIEFHSSVKIISEFLFPSSGLPGKAEGWDSGNCSASMSVFS